MITSHYAIESRQDILLSHHLVERGAGQWLGQFALVRIDQTIRFDGSIAVVGRRLVRHFPSEAEANFARERRDAKNVRR